jgi:hypothetical protein
MDREHREDLHTMPPEEQLAAMGLTPESGAGPGTGSTGQEADLPDLAPDQQLAAMGLTSEPEAEPGTELAGQEADLPSLPVDQQLAAMGLASQPEAELASQRWRPMRPSEPRKRPLRQPAADANHGRLSEPRSRCGIG